MTTNDDKENEDDSPTHPNFEKVNNLPARSATSELADPSLLESGKRGRVANFFARAVSASERVTHYAKKLELESLEELIQARESLQLTIAKATIADARHEQLDNVMDAARFQAVRDLDREHQKAMAEIEDGLIDLEEREVEREERREEIRRRKERLEITKKYATDNIKVVEDREGRKVIDRKEKLDVEDFERQVDREERVSNAKVRQSSFGLSEDEETFEDEESKADEELRLAIVEAGDEEETIIRLKDAHAVIVAEIRARARAKELMDDE